MVNNVCINVPSPQRDARRLGRDPKLPYVPLQCACPLWRHVGFHFQGIIRGALSKYGGLLLAAWSPFELIRDPLPRLETDNVSGAEFNLGTCDFRPKMGLCAIVCNCRASEEDFVAKTQIAPVHALGARSTILLAGSNLRLSYRTTTRWGAYSEKTTDR